MYFSAFFFTLSVLFLSSSTQKHNESNSAFFIFTAVRYSVVVMHDLYIHFPIGDFWFITITDGTALNIQYLFTCEFGEVHNM